MAVSIIAGLILGHYVDEWAETKTPWFTFTGLIVGAISGFSLLIRLTKRKDDYKSDESNKDTDAR
ncbi:MAG: AtpZ/AtpI family protein [Deltaproteobacteria bacterium]|nr:AtpZ/AtpI family protein [Deltaproteobacteria bacterium]